MPIRVSIIEDDASFRDSLRTVLQATPDLLCASVHPNSEHALRFLGPARPDVVLVDIRMPRVSGIECVRRLRATMPPLLPIILTSFSDDESIFESLKAGAVGYLLKRSTPDEILDAIRQAHQGGSPMTPEIARRVTAYFHELNGAEETKGVLTPREDEILRLMRLGKNSKEVAETLGIALPTVHAHLRNIYDKLHVGSRTAALAKYFGWR